MWQLCKVESIAGANCVTTQIACEGKPPAALLPFWQMDGWARNLHPSKYSLCLKFDLPPQSALHRTWCYLKHVLYLKQVHVQRTNKNCR